MPYYQPGRTINNGDIASASYLTTAISVSGFASGATVLIGNSTTATSSALQEITLGNGLAFSGTSLGISGTAAFGIWLTPQSSSATFAQGLLFQPGISGTASAATFYGAAFEPLLSTGANSGCIFSNIEVETPGITGSALATSYQVFIGQGVAASSQYGIYQYGTDQNVFSGPVSVPSNAPVSSGATGTAGTITYDSSFIYVCVNTNSWKRVAIAAW